MGGGPGPGKGGTMGTKKRWQDVNYHHLGMAVLQALANRERGDSGEVEIDLDGRWVKIVIDRHLCRVILFEVDAPPELRDPGEEG